MPRQTPGIEEEREQRLSSVEKAIQTMAARYARVQSPDWEDMCQECRMHVWRRLPEYDPTRAQFYAWARPIIRSSCLHWIRDQSRIIREPAWRWEAKGVTLVDVVSVGCVDEESRRGTERADDAYLGDCPDWEPPGEPDIEDDVLDRLVKIDALRGAALTDTQARAVVAAFRGEALSSTDSSALQNVRRKIRRFHSTPSPSGAQGPCAW